MCRACYCISPNIRKRKYLVFIVLTIGFISIFGDVVSAASVTPGLVVSYNGNITAGRLIDLSGNSNTGYVIGATQGTLLTTANYISFDGVRNRVNILANDSTNITNNLSVEFIGNIRTFNRYGILAHKYQSGVSGWYISTSPNAPYNTIKFGLVGSDASLHNYVSNIQLNSSEYYHTVVTYDGTTAHIYVNSVDSANPAYFGVPIAGSSENTSLYYSPSIFNNTKGNLLLFRMYNRTLTQAEVTQNYEDNKWRYPSTTMQPGIYWIWMNLREKIWLVN
ncbi:MAG: LamG domain-containing protein [Alphaproteobacteria bacterium]|nr:MAG: LamG domain-containing protein [Alphaproteobacteria bacterium]